MTRVNLLRKGATKVVWTLTPFPLGTTPVPPTSVWETNYCISKTYFCHWNGRG